MKPGLIPGNPPSDAISVHPDSRAPPLPCAARTSATPAHCPHGQRRILHDVLGQTLGFREHLLLGHHAVHDAELIGFFRREVAARQGNLGGETPRPRTRPLPSAGLHRCPAALPGSEIWCRRRQRSRQWPSPGQSLPQDIAMDRRNDGLPVDRLPDPEQTSAGRMPPAGPPRRFNSSTGRS